MSVNDDNDNKDKTFDGQDENTVHDAGRRAALIKIGKYVAPAFLVNIGAVADSARAQTSALLRPPAPPPPRQAGARLEPVSFPAIPAVALPQHKPYQLLVALGLRHLALRR